MPVTRGGQIHSPVVVSQVATDGQLHDLQSGNPKYPVLQASHRRPIILGLHWHCPPYGSHTKLNEPSESQEQGRAPLLYAVVNENVASLQKPTQKIHRDTPRNNTKQINKLQIKYIFHVQL